MYYTGTVFGGYVVAAYHPERVAVRLNPRYQLTIAYAHQFGTFVTSEHPERDILTASVVFFHLKLCASGREIGPEQLLGYHYRDRIASVRIESGHTQIVYLRTYGEGGVRGKRPRSGGPCKEI